MLILYYTKVTNILSFLYVKKASPNFNIMRITYVLFQIIRCEAIFKINLLLADRP